MVEELKANAAAEARFCGTSDAGASTPHGGIALSTGAGGCSQDVDQRINSILPLLPKQLPRLFCSKERRIFLYCNVLESTVLALGKVGKVAIELW